MSWSPYRLLYGSAPAEFKSAFGLQETVERLRAATKRSAFSALAQSAAVGPVKETKVRLQRVIPMIGNSFKPFFFGRFEARPDGIYLTGRFTLLPLVKVFMTIWLGATALMGVGAALTGRGNGLAVALGGLGMTGFGIAFIAFGKWLARNDVQWLSGVIRTALGVPAPPTATAPATVPSEQPTPLVLRVAAGVLALGGAVNLVGLLANRTLNGPMASQFGEPLFRTSIAVMSVLMLCLAIGIYRRKLVAWRAGLAFLAASAALSVYQVFVIPPFRQPLFLELGESAVMLIVFAVWARWWYAQRIHFLQDESAWTPSDT